MSSQQPTVPVDDEALAKAHESGPAASLSETTRRALLVYRLLDNPEEVLDVHGADVPAAHVDESRK